MMFKIVLFVGGVAIGVAVGLFLAFGGYVLGASKCL